MNERLTVKPDSGLGLIGCIRFKDDCDENCFDCDVIEIFIKKLQQYEDAEEAGLLINLPVKVGQTVYIVTKTQGIVAAKVRVFWIGKLSCQNVPRELMIRTDYCDIPAENLGKTVFLTRQEAEKTLEATNAN